MAKKVKQAEVDRLARDSKFVARASLTGVRMSPRKARYILDMIRGMQVEPALHVLQHNPRKGARVVEKLLQSAIANAREKSSVDIDDLWVTSCRADMGKTQRRFLPRAQGRATRIRKRSTHIHLGLGEK